MTKAPEGPDGLPLDGHLTPMISGLAFGARLIARSVTRVRIVAPTKA